MKATILQIAYPFQDNGLFEKRASFSKKWSILPMETGILFIKQSE